MNMEAKLKALDKTYALYDEFAASLETACHKGCAICCTANVTLTTLEGARLLDTMAAAGLAGRPVDDKGRGFRPQITTNHMAALCMEDKDLPEEAMSPDPGPCPLLDKEFCPVYDSRPFACRCMVSTRNCADTGAADMNDWIFTVNHLFLQAIEHLDCGGCSGNLTDVLGVLAIPAKRALWKTGNLLCRAEGLIPNRPIPVLMIPPEYREKAMPWVERLRRCIEG